MKEKYSLHLLCENSQNTLETIQECLDSGVDINLLNETGDTALSISIQKRILDFVCFLLEKGANPHIATSSNFPPLVWAVFIDTELNSEKFTSAFLQHPEIDVNHYQLQQLTALYTSVQFGNERIFDLLIKAGAKPIDALINGHYVSPLTAALNIGHEGIAEKLIGSFSELVNKKNTLNLSPLYQAAEKGMTHLVDLLIRHGGNVHACYRGITPLSIAAQNGHDKVVLSLIQAGAEYSWIGPADTAGKMATPLRVASMFGHIETVQVLLNFTHPCNALEHAIHYAASEAMKCRNAETRKKIYTCSELINKKLIEMPAQRILTLDDYVRHNWEVSFKTLFSKTASDKDKYPDNKNAAIRRALASMYEMLNNAPSCVPYLQFLSLELEKQWEREHSSQAFPKFDISSIELWSHHGLLWPIPLNDTYPCMKKANLLEGILLDKFRQYGMGEEKPSKWTGFIPKGTSKTLLSKNAFFTENRRTINGLFHGNVHNIQRVILLFAMESGHIPLTWTTENGETEVLEPREVFSALMRRDIFLSPKSGALWTDMLDSGNKDEVSFTLPHCLNSMILTNSAFAGTLQDYMRFSFCNHFIKMRQLFNHVHGTTHTNKTLCHELGKLKFETFGGIFEFAIQMDEKKVLAKVERLDELENKGRSWSIQPKPYKVPSESTANYGDFLGIFRKKTLFNPQERETLRDLANLYTRFNSSNRTWKDFEEKMDIEHVAFTLQSAHRNPDLLKTLLILIGKGLKANEPDAKSAAYLFDSILKGKYFEHSIQKAFPAKDMLTILREKPLITELNNALENYSSNVKCDF